MARSKINRYLKIDKILGGCPMSSRDESRGNWVFGLVLLLVGVIFIVENFTGIEVWNKFWKFWPVILLIWGVKEIFQNKSIFFGVILIAISAIFLGQYFFDFNLSGNIWNYWPILLIALGIDQVFRSFRGDRVHYRRKKEKENQEI